MVRSDSKDLESNLELVRIFALRGETQRAYSGLLGLVERGFTDSSRILDDPEFSSLTDYPPAREVLAKAASETE